MPFLGKQPTAGFASIVKDDLTADGSTTAFTLSKQVANANDIAVFVGNVRQEPTDAYSVSGTTLTMTAAPASAINFYVLHIAGTVESSVIPADGTISSAKVDSSVPTIAGTNAFTGSNTFSERVNITGGPSTRYGVYDDALRVKGDSYSYLEIEGTNSQAGIILNKDGSTGMGIGYSNAGRLKIKPIASIDQTGISNWKDQNTSGLEVDTNGYIFKPNQVSFFAGWATTSNAGGYGSVQYGNGFSRVGWNIGSGWNSSDTFTAPVTGKYLMCMAMGFTSGAYNIHLGFYINGGGGTTGQGNSNGDPWLQTGRGNEGSSDQDHVMVSRIFNLNANDTLKPVYLIFDNDNNSQIYQNRSFVSGYLLG